jgi:methyl-accepting chemotaxis protein
MWLRKFSLKKRVLAGFGTAAMLLLGFGGAAAWTLRAHGADTTVIGAFALVAVAAAAALALGGWLTSLSITRPVEALVGSVTRIAGGDLETKVVSEGKDELSWLSHEVNQMRKKLQKTVLSVHESVHAVAQASQQIAQGNGDLSERTTSQADALQRTSATMQELASAVHGNAKNAGEASALVSQTQTVATRGGELMQQVVARMGDIDKSASRIAEIIGVIDGISFQTNLLALNAAVEAARAGEHGRGFAVVAAEVRRLAQRCADAASEVKTLIGDSAGHVSAGSQLVDQAGTTMRDLLAGVGRVSQIVGAIATAGEQQRSGIDQVHEAIAQMDEMTQRNAALVDQAAAAAQSLNGQSQKLRETMGAFRVAAA